MGDYIDKAVEESRKEAEAAGSGTPTQTTLTTEAEEVSCVGFCDPLLSLNTPTTPGPLAES